MPAKRKSSPTIKIPDEFLCPITSLIMYDPVMICDGHTFERSAINRWFTTKSSSPITNLPLKHREIYPNYVVKNLINKFLEENPTLKSQQYSPLEDCVEKCDTFLKFVMEKDANLIAMKEWFKKNEDYKTKLDAWLRELFEKVYREKRMDAKDIQSIRILLECNANPNQTTLTIPLLFIPIFLRNFEFAKELIQKWKSSVLLKSAINASILYHTIIQTNTSTPIDFVRFLVEEQKVDINLQTVDGNTALMASCFSAPNENICKYLLSTQNILTDAQNANGNTALHISIVNNCHNQAKLLVDKGASLTVRNKDGYDPCALLLSRLENSSNVDRVALLNLFEKMLTTGYAIATRSTDPKSALNVLERFGHTRLCHMVYQIIIFSQKSNLQSANSVTASQTQAKITRFITAGADKTIRVWDMETKYFCFAISSQNSQIVSLITLDENRIVCAEANGAIRIWNLQNKACEKMMAHSLVSTLLKFNNRILVSAGASGVIKLWDLENNGNLIGDMTGHTSNVVCVRKIDANRIVSVSSDLTCKIWDTSNRTCTSSFAYGSATASCMEVIDSNRIIIGDDSSKVTLWDITKKQSIKQLVHSSVKTVLKLNSQLFLTAGHDKNIRIWDLEKEEPTKILRNNSRIYGVAILDENTLLSYDLMGNVKFWDVATGNVISFVTAHSKCVSSLVLC